MGKDVGGEVTAAVADGDHLRVLRALQAHLAEDLEAATSGAVAQIAHQLRMVTAEIAALAPKEGGSVVDEIAARRAERKSRAARKPKAAAP